MLTNGDRIAHAEPLGAQHAARVRPLSAVLLEVALFGAIAFVAFIGLGLIPNPWYRIVAIEGGSMEPTFTQGDLIVVRPAPSTIEAGMILVVAVNDEVVTHRVVAVNGDGTFRTRGDANGADDQWDPQDVHVQGQYVAAIPWLGRILPIPYMSGALFADGATATMSIGVGPFIPSEPPPTPDACSDMSFGEVLVGTSGDDEFHAANGGALVFGLGGNDVLYGGNGKDCLVGGDGNDTLSGGNSKDVLLGGEGDDRLEGGDEDDAIGGGNGRDVLDGGPGVDGCDGGLGRDELIDCEPPTPLQDQRSEPEETAGPSNSAEPSAEPTDPAETLAPSPVPTPEATEAPAASPGVDPSPPPSATPLPPPDPSPSPAAVVDPSPEPEGSPDPTASLESTASAEQSETPEATAS